MNTNEYSHIYLCNYLISQINVVTIIIKMFNKHFAKFFKNKLVIGWKDLHNMFKDKL